jgi:Domain of unknown function (DUF4386)
MYRSGLVPRGIAVLGLVGGSLIVIAATAELFSLFQQTSATGDILGLPEALFEASLGIWLTVKGFKPSPIISGTIQQVGAGGPSATARPTVA